MTQEIVQGKFVFKVNSEQGRIQQNLVNLINNLLIHKKYFIFCSAEIYKIFCSLLITNYTDKIKFIRCLKKVNVINDKSRQLEIIQQTHDSNNHRGIIETFNELRMQYFWQNYHNDVIKYINNCELCQRNKYDRHPFKPPLQLTETCNKPKQKILADVYQMKRKIYLTLLDFFSKFAQAYEINSKTPTQVVRALIQYFQGYGLPENIVFDAGNEFNHTLV